MCRSELQVCSSEQPVCQQRAAGVQKRATGVQKRVSSVQKRAPVCRRSKNEQQKPTPRIMFESESRPPHFEPRSHVKYLRSASKNSSVCGQHPALLASKRQLDRPRLSRLSRNTVTHTLRDHQIHATVFSVQRVLGRRSFATDSGERCRISSLLSTETQTALPTIRSQ